MNRMEVLIDGEWVEVGGATAPEWFTTEADEMTLPLVEADLVTEQTWSTTLTFEVEEGVESPADLIARLHREAIERAYAARMWLAYPFFAGKGPLSCTHR